MQAYTGTFELVPICSHVQRAHNMGIGVHVYVGVRANTCSCARISTGDWQSPRFLGWFVYL